VTAQPLLNGDRKQIRIVDSTALANTCRKAECCQAQAAGLPEHQRSMATFGVLPLTT
jgi:hypothetical protein